MAANNDTNILEVISEQSHRYRADRLEKQLAEARAEAAAREVEHARMIDNATARLVEMTIELCDLKRELRHGQVHGPLRLSSQDAKRIRSFVHPDKHTQCGHADKAHEVSVILQPMLGGRK